MWTKWQTMRSWYIWHKRILETFQIDLQWEALEMVVGRDMFVIQPKGSGKSLIFQSALIFFHIVRPECAKLIILIISPLVSLMKGQVHCLKSLGISAESIGDAKKPENVQKEDSAKFTRGVSVNQNMTSSGFGLVKISPHEKRFADLALVWSSPWWRDFGGAATLGRKSEGTARFTLILLKIFLQRVMKSFHIFLELLKVLQI